MRALSLPLLLIVLIPLAAGSSSAHPDHRPRPPIDPHQPIRRGFTLELGIGVGFTHLLPKSGTRESKVGLAPLSLSLGGFVTNELAILFRMAGTSFFRRTIGDNLQVWVLGFYGVHVQYWFNRWLMLSGGPGLALFGAVANRTTLDPKITAGFGLNLRLGFAVATWTHHALRFSLELFPGVFKNQTIMSESVIFEWQWF